MPNKNKALGSGLETRVVNRAHAHGLPAHKQPGSGTFTAFPNDVVVTDLLGECKVRSTHPSFNELDEWLTGAERNAAGRFRGAFLVYNPKGSRHPRVMLDLDLFLSILTSAILDTEAQKVVQ